MLDPRIAHVGRCPYCLRRIMQLREEKRFPRQKVTAFKPVLAATVVLLVGVFTLYRVFPLKKEAQQPAVVARVLDLRGQAAIRGPKTVYPPMLILPRAQDKVTLVLPVLSEEGTYRIQLLSDRNSGTVLASTQGVTVRQEDQLRLPVLLDLHQVPAGPYHLSTTYGADEASYYYAVQVGP